MQLGASVLLLGVGAPQWFLCMSDDGALEDHDAAQDPASGGFGIWRGDAPDREPDPETERVESQAR